MFFYAFINLENISNKNETQQKEVSKFELEIIHSTLSQTMYETW